jgi:UDP-2-acetamido-3-amino-2,3-dideoxy-glucuronate N-acetyltransferase
MAQPYIHALTDVQASAIGGGTRSWEFVVVLPGAQIEQDWNICSHCLTENDVVIGDRVTVKSGVQLWDGLRVGYDVFFGPNVTFPNDKHPRSKQYPQHFSSTIVMAGASVGGGASWHNDWAARHGGRRCSRHPTCAGRWHRSRQPGAHHRRCGGRS